MVNLLGSCPSTLGSIPSTHIMKVKLPEWRTWSKNAERSKERILNRTCKNCHCTFKENGLSAYEGVCQKCVDAL